MPKPTPACSSLSRMAPVFILTIVVAFLVQDRAAFADDSHRPFVHPGMLHGRADLEFIGQKVKSGQEPWKSAWAGMLAERVASLDWSPRPRADVFRGPYNNPDRGSSDLMNDSLAAYCHALQWAVTGEPAHARKATAILNAWARELRSIEGSDRQLLAGITAYKFANAAEILRHTPGSGWTAGDTSRTRAMMLNVFYPLIEPFKPKANGNWDAAMINSMLCIGIFCDDRAKFDRATDYFLHGAGNGAIAHYVSPTGQCQESTRDQSHTQLGLGMLAAACETAWKQGVDLYGAEGNRLALGFEYTARYNLGFDVPVAGSKPISAQYRGRFRPIYEKVYQHYALDKGVAMPFTKQVIDKIRPEGSSKDHEGWGTLLFFKGE